MTVTSPFNVLPSTWFAENQRYLMAEVNKICQILESKVSQSTTESADSRSSKLSFQSSDIEIFRESFEALPILERLCQRFHLSAFESQILLLCAGAELSGKFRALFAALQGDPQRAYPTFGMAFSLFPNGGWAAITPDFPLRRWQMIEVMPGVELTHSPLRIDEHILHQLMGIEHLDSRLQGLVTVTSPSQLTTLPASHQEIVQQISQLGIDTKQSSPVIQLWGGDSRTKYVIAAAVAVQHGLCLHTINLEALPKDHSQVKLLKKIWERDSIMAQSLLLLNCDPLSTRSADESAQLQDFAATIIETTQRPLMVASAERLPQRQRPLFSIELHPPSPHEQRQLWQRHLASVSENNGHQLNDHIDQLVTYFNLSPSGIQSVCERVAAEKNRKETGSLLWKTCLAQARPKLGELAQLMRSNANWSDLILPETELQVLKTMAAHVQQRSTVYEKWGFASRGQRGLGISALFAGASGTGKTLAAETLANQLNLDLYRIDLSMVVSKYIGETEKNLRRIFDGAEKGGAILLFDEADALFGKRSDVKDARDRYANMEVAYLLQRIEAYRGLAILTTNLKDSLDQAFLRRIRFVVQFPFPDATQREKIWRCSFPSQVPLGDLKFKTLAKLNIAGGNIRNIVLNAAFLAADEGGRAVEMRHVIKAAQSEYIKLERPLTELRDRDIQKWIS